MRALTAEENEVVGACIMEIQAANDQLNLSIAFGSMCGALAMLEAQEVITAAECDRRAATGQMLVEIRKEQLLRSAPPCG